MTKKVYFVKYKFSPNTYITMGTKDGISYPMLSTNINNSITMGSYFMIKSVIENFCNINPDYKPENFEICHKEVIVEDSK